MKVTSLDLFPTHVKIFDHGEDPELHAELARQARTNPKYNSSISGESLLSCDAWWAKRLRERLDASLAVYLKDTFPGRAERFAVDAYAFFNFTGAMSKSKTSFTPPHDHLIEADLVGVYYVVTRDYPAEPPGSYYALEDGVLVLHDPRADARLDRRSPETRDHYAIRPRPGRLVLQPAHVRHTVTPNSGEDRIAVACGFAIDRKSLFEGYVSYEL